MIRSQLRWIAVLTAAVIVIGCGGGLVAGVGSGGSGFAAGTITGFGSIIADGNSWDVRDARIEAQIDPSQPAALAEAKLGQRVEIDFQNSGTANTVRIEANVVGRVGDISASATPPSFTVAGQTVRINTNADNGPITIFVGYTTIADLRVSDAVEVHGTALFDSALGRYVIQATRIEELTTLPAGLIRVGGVVEALGAGSFRLGGLTVNITTSTVIVPASRALANGQRVVIWGHEPLAAGPSLNADFIRIKDAPPAAGAGEVAGSISRLDVGRLTFEVDGMSVDARTAVVVPANQALANGVYVVATGTFSADGTLSAAQVRIRRSGTGEAQVQLKGAITDFVNAGNFLVRGVPVDATAATMSGCGNTPLASGVFIEVAGNIVSNIVTAVTITCDAMPPADATLTFTGTANNVNVDARTFTLSIAGAATRAASWSDRTLFVDVTPAALASKTVEVEGFIRQGVLVATKIKLAA
jgi:hypothetical protein